MVSIVTTVYKNDKYIEESLNSIIESCHGIEFEILVGIDNCEISINHLLSLYPKLNENIKIFYFTNKVGTYIIRNTLVNKSKYDNIIFFDSDDVMRKNTVFETTNRLNSGYDVFRFGLIPFSGTLNYPKDGDLVLPFSYPYGAFGIRKKVFLEMNGFEPWECAADGEFYWRLTSNNYKIYKSREINLFYRRHGENLTLSESTGMKSLIRKNYHDKKELKIKHSLNKPLPELTVSNSIYINNIRDYNNLIGILKKKQISIIIPTFNTPEFLKECLDSILDSVKNINCEILVGVDDCDITLDFIKKNKFDNKINFFLFQKNVGPYVIKNSLSEISNSDILLFFDSDDIMEESMVTDIIRYSHNSTVIKPKYVNFRYKTEDYEKKEHYGEGVFAIKKSVFLEMNGFEPWRCAADSDFMGRIYKNGVSFKHTDKIMFFRRIHPNSLTQIKETSYISELRKEYIKKSKNKKGKYSLPFLSKENFIKIVPKSYEGKSIEYDIIFPEIKQDNSDLLNKLIKVKPEDKNKVIDYEKLNKILHEQGVYDPKKNVKKPRIVENNPIDRSKLIEIKKGSNLDALKKNMKSKPNRRNGLPNIFSKKNKK